MYIYIMCIYIYNVYIYIYMTIENADLNKKIEVLWDFIGCQWDMMGTSRDNQSCDHWICPKLGDPRGKLWGYRISDSSK